MCTSKPFFLGATKRVFAFCVLYTEQLKSSLSPETFWSSRHKLATLMLKTLFLSLKEESAYSEDRVEGALNYIPKAEPASGEQDQFSFVLAFFSPL